MRTSEISTRAALDSARHFIPRASFGAIVFAALGHVSNQANRAGCEAERLAWLEVTRELRELHALVAMPEFSGAPRTYIYPSAQPINLTR